MKKVSIIGIGMDGKKTLTAEAENIIKSADVLIGAKRMTNGFSQVGKPVWNSYNDTEIAEFIHSCQHENIAVLMSGDCGFYSGAQKLIPLISSIETEVISAISSPVYFCSKLKNTWQDVHFVSLHGAVSNIARNVATYKKTFFLLGGQISAKDVCKRLCKYGLENVTAHIGENLSYENERILSGKAREFINVQTESLAVMLVENPDYEKGIKSGIADDEFIRGKVPMTKSEVRGIVISKLEICHDSICWDIGCGTGSVSVEMAIQCYDGTVYAIEKNSEAIDLTDKNRMKHKCDNIEIIEGKASGILADLPAPDCVFIGGSSGKINEICEIVYSKNPSAIIVVTAVSLETLNDCMNTFNCCNILNPEVVQIAVTRTKKIGQHTMFTAENPIFIIKGKKL